MKVVRLSLCRASTVRLFPRVGVAGASQTLGIVRHRAPHLHHAYSCNCQQGRRCSQKATNERQDAVSDVAEISKETPAGEAAASPSAETTQASSADAASAADVPDVDQAPKLNEPLILWKAQSLAKEFEETEKLVAYSAAAVGGGMGLAFLGIAAFTPPNWFMGGVVLAVFQVRLGHTWMTRLMQAHARRHVTELTCTRDSNGNDVTLSIKFDGGLSRTLNLTSTAVAKDAEPPIKDIFGQGASFIYFDHKLGRSENSQAFEELLQSEYVVASESVDVTPFSDEAQNDAEKTVQHFKKLSRSHLEKISKSDPSPQAALAQLVRFAQSSAAVLTLGGAFMFVAGRNAPLPSSASSADT
mmetsp:Transcript_41376/g.81750  ORF Transcript_41376/g.81750 Transcript_41376/m.81750 type:complete len:357 (-) Transcript_41376:43-1113(-)